MPTRPLDLVTKTRSALGIFYASSVACALVVSLAQQFHNPQRRWLFAFAALSAVCAVGSLYRFFRTTDEFRKQINYRAIKFAFIGTLIFSLAVSFLKSFGFPLVSPYATPAVMAILWSIGLFVSSWRYQ